MGAGGLLFLLLALLAVFLVLALRRKPAGGAQDKPPTRDEPVPSPDRGLERDAAEPAPAPESPSSDGSIGSAAAAAVGGALLVGYMAHRAQSDGGADAGPDQDTDSDAADGAGSDGGDGSSGDGDGEGGDGGGGDGGD